jgi:hypothetical protein
MLKLHTKIGLGLLLLVGVLGLMGPHYAQALCGDSNLQTVSSAFKFNSGACDVNSFIILIVKWIISIMGMVAVAMVVYGGFLYMTSGVNEKNTAKGKSIIFNAMIGLAIVLLAYVIVAVVTSVFSNGSGSGSGNVSGGATSGNGQTQTQDESLEARRSAAIQRIRDGIKVTYGGTSPNAITVFLNGKTDDLRQFCPQASGSLTADGVLEITYDQNNIPAINKNLSSESAESGTLNYNLRMIGLADHAIIPNPPQGTGEYEPIDLEKVHIKFLPTFEFGATDFSGACSYTLPAPIITTAEPRI